MIKRTTFILILSLFGCTNNTTLSTLTPNAADPWQTIYCGSERSPEDDMTVYRRTSRMKVPTGWIYKTTMETTVSSTLIENTIFVPDTTSMLPERKAD